MSSSPEPAKKTTRKRASAASDDEYVPSSSSAPAPTKKRARVSKTVVTTIEVDSDSDDALNPDARALVARILKKPATFRLPDEEDPHDALRVPAKYARSLEKTATASATVVPSARTREQVELDAENIRKAARAQIPKQMHWKAACKTGAAKWSYDGVVPDADTFAALMHLDSPPTWSRKKFSVDDFEAAIGHNIHASARYSTLRLKRDVNVQWHPTTGEFKFSGNYGSYGS